MGGGSWTTTSYTCAINNMGFSNKTALASSTVQNVYRMRALARDLDPKGVIRECRDTDEHPNTIPVILALDVTGSMGNAAKMCAAKLDDIMTELYKSVTDIEFLMMGIGDLAYDLAPIQASQFESDIRILDQTTKIYFEAGGGGNSFESYTAAWYFGLNNTDLDCWKRGKKGIIITLGDEPLNPYLPGKALSETLGTNTQDVDTKSLYDEVTKKFGVYHIAITDHSSYRRYENAINESWGKLLGQHFMTSTSDKLPEVISSIVNDSINNYTVSDSSHVTVSDEGISW